MKPITIHTGSALAGAAVLALVILATGAAQSSMATPLDLPTNGGVRPGSPPGESVRSDFDRAQPANSGDEDVLLYSVPFGKTLLIEGATGYGSTSLFMTRNVGFIAAGLGGWIQVLYANNQSLVWEAPMIFHEGETIWMAMEDSGSLEQYHFSFTGRLVDAR